MVTTGVSSTAGPPTASPGDPYALEARHRIPAVLLLIVVVLGLAGAGVVARRTTAGIAEQRAAERALPPNLPLPAVDDFRRADAVRLGRAQSGQPWVQLGEIGRAHV